VVDLAGVVVGRAAGKSVSGEPVSGVVLTDPTLAASLLTRRHNNDLADASMAEAFAPQCQSRSNSPKSASRASALEASQRPDLGSWREAKNAASCAVAIVVEDDEHEHHLWEKVRDLMRQRRKQFEEGNGESPGLRAKASTANQRARPSTPARTVRTAERPSRPSTRSTTDLSEQTLAISSQLRAAGEPVQAPSSDGMVQTHTREIKVLRETIEVMKEERKAQDWQLLDALAQANAVTPSPLRSVPPAP